MREWLPSSEFPPELYFLNIRVFPIDLLASVAWFLVDKVTVGPFEALYELGLLFPDEDKGLRLAPGGRGIVQLLSKSVASPRFSTYTSTICF